MESSYLMYSASVLYFVCYIPELYANYKNKNINIYNIPEKVIMLIATVMAFSYSVLIDSPELMANYGPLLAFDIVAINMRLYYLYLNTKVKSHESLPSLEKTELSLENNV